MPIESGSSKKSFDELEQQFKEFVRKLLDAQSYDFLDERALFTRKTLEKTLNEFCDIIAENIGADSCTVQLKLYDPRMLGDEALGHMCDPKLKDMKLSESRQRIRHHWMASTLTFPYWRYPKGAAVLVAANRLIHGESSDAPWYPVLHANDWQARIAELKAGISTHIFQENVARIRDRLSIRNTRHFQKLGSSDQLVWNNSELAYAFRNFYGAPIRIHSGGEVIGLLKVENKSIERLREPLDELLNEGIDDPKQICKSILEQNARFFPDGAQRQASVAPEKEGAIGQTIKNFDRDWKFSYFSLAYLERDLEHIKATKELSGLKFEDILLLPFPQCAAAMSVPQEMEAGYRSLVAGEARPPVQIFTTNLEDERTLIRNLFKGDPAGLSFHDIYEKVKDFYGGVVDKIMATPVCWKENLRFHNIDELKEGIKRGFPDPGPEAIKHVRLEKLDPSGQIPDFNLCFDVTFVEGPQIRLHLFVPPTRKEIQGNVKKEAYVERNRFWLGTDTKSKEWRASWSDTAAKTGKPFGEVFRIKEGAPVTDLALDRLAARIQAFWFSLRIPDFDEEDTRKVSWAAYEIGKLIEREISYRANHHADPIPLTAMEFFRIPISDLNFVDDLRARRHKLHGVANEVRGRINRAIFGMDMDGAVEFSSRVKSYRSALLRIGERHEGHVRGNLAIWFYLLAVLSATKKDKRRENTATADDGKGPGALLAAFHGNLDLFRDSIDRELFREDRPSELAELKKDAIPFFEEYHGSLLGGLRFDTPPFSCKKELLGKAVERLLNNLTKEKFLDTGLAAGLEPGSGFENFASYLKGPQGPFRQFHDLLYRNYDSFARASFSLLAQLVNQVNAPEAKPYKAFYRFCHGLRIRLSLTQRDIEDHKEHWGMRAIFKGEPWKKIMECLDAHNTRAFHKARTGKEENIPSYLFLDEDGIYKRLRTLHHTLRHQSSAASLDWELGRFDLFGSHLNCLFKNQVFALYETLWAWGDPFHKEKRENGNDGKDEQGNAKEGKVKGNDGRANEKKGPSENPGALPWLCLRTSVQQDHYNALQISALVDPPSLEKNKDLQAIYTLRRVQSTLHGLFSEFHGELLHTYEDFTKFRNDLKKEYLDWHKLSLAVSRHEAFPTDSKTWLRFGTYLFAGVFDLLLLFLNRYLNLKEEKKRLLPTKVFNGFRELISTLPDILYFGTRYAHRLLEKGGSPNQSVAFDCSTPRPKINELCADCQGRWESDLNIGEGCWARPRKKCLIYEKAMEFARDLEEIWEGQGDRKMLSFIAEELEKERNQFGSEEKASEFATPLFFVTHWNPENEPGPQTGPDDFGLPNRFEEAEVWTDFIPLINKKYRAQAKKKRKISNKDAHIFRTVIERLRREQKAYLFYRGSCPESGKPSFPGLWLREKEQVFERLCNYVLLFNPKEDGKDADMKSSWTAYDLFYYLRSLIPIEIQIRTELADTVAEQYHGPVYKGKPPAGTELPRSMMEEVGRRLNEVDVEMEIDYEDYVNDYYWHSRHEPEEPETP